MESFKVALDIKKINVKEKQRNNSSLLSSPIRGYYTLETLNYGVHHRGLQLVDLFEDYPG